MVNARRYRFFLTRSYFCEIGLIFPHQTTHGLRPPPHPNCPLACAKAAQNSANEWAKLTPVGTLEIKLGATRLRLEAHGKQSNETMPWHFVEELASFIEGLLLEHELLTPFFLLGSSEYQEGLIPNLSGC